MSDTRIIVFANQKGGCGKSLLCAEFAARLRKRGNRVLGVDMDPQGSLSMSVNVDTRDKATMYEVLKGEKDIRDIICHTGYYDIAPANIYLASAEQELTAKIGRERMLAKVLKGIKSDYDYILIDTGPSLGNLNINALTAADEVIIPTIPDLHAAVGIDKLCEIIGMVKETCNPVLDIAGVVLTRYDRHKTNSQTIKAILSDISENLGINTFNTTIRQAEAVNSARTSFQTVEEYCSRHKSPNNTAVSADIEALLDEYLKLEEEKSWL